MARKASGGKSRDQVPISHTIFKLEARPKTITIEYWKLIVSIIVALIGAAASLIALLRHTRHINVSSNPAGADVLVDGDFVGNAPAALKLSRGKHTVTVKMSGYKDWTKDIAIESGSDVQLAANLEK